MAAVDTWDTVFPTPVHDISAAPDDVWGDLDPVVEAARKLERAALQQAEMRKYFERLSTLEVERTPDNGYRQLALVGECEFWVPAMEWDEDRQTFDDCGGTETGEGVVAYAPSEFDALYATSNGVRGYSDHGAQWFDESGVPFADDEYGERTLLVSLDDLRHGITLDDLTPHYVAVGRLMFAAGVTDTREWRKTSDEGIPVDYLAELYRPVA